MMMTTTTRRERRAARMARLNAALDRIEARIKKLNDALDVACQETADAQTREQRLQFSYSWAYATHNRLWKKLHRLEQAEARELSPLACAG